MSDGSPSGPFSPTTIVNDGELPGCSYAFGETSRGYPDFAEMGGDAPIESLEPAQPPVLVIVEDGPAVAPQASNTMWRPWDASPLITPHRILQPVVVPQPLLAPQPVIVALQPTSPPTIPQPIRQEGSGQRKRSASSPPLDVVKPKRVKRNCRKYLVYTNVLF